MNSRSQIRALPLLLSASAVLALSACHPAPEPAPHPAPAAAGSEHADFGPHRSPVVVRLSGPAQVQAGQDVELVAEIDQFVGSQSSVSLDLVLPAGTRLVAGNASEQLPPGNGTLTRRFVVHLDSVPETNVELVARAGNASFGAHAKSAYRFGRPEPKLAQPKRGTDELIIGGRSLGHPIELKPPSASPSAAP
jgi:hypothetical protein